MDQRYSEALRYIKRKYNATPDTGIILGTGLGGLVKDLNVELEIPYSSIPHFPLSTVEHHAGKLIFGTLGNKVVMAMQGRFHFYEGYSMFQITFPVRIMKLMGVENLFISNVSGGISNHMKKGDLVIIDDHINLQTANPLTGNNENSFGPRFPDMSEPYDQSLIEKALQICTEEGIVAHKGVYAAVNGPNLETRAEYRFLGRIGADIVGMSTVPEVIVAKHMSMKVFAISLITDECDPENLHPVSIDEIVEIATASEPKLTKVINKLIKSI
ncbi:purine-nucleoside phosphorylase [Cytophagaceae bacterium ABcell3]|nr:purine-nucleoside phosphorylase [Cytophagaceae bacterium ABcell3]